MSRRFPLPLACLTLEHIVDDVDAIEGYLSEDPDATNCLPVILRNIYFMNPENEKYGLPMLNTIPDAGTTLRYLQALWYPGAHYDRLINAARLGALYLLPEILADVKSAHCPRYITIASILVIPLREAAKNGYTDVVKFLHDAGAVISEHPSDASRSAVTMAAKNGHNDTVMYLLAHEADDESRDLGIRFAMGEAISTDNLELLQMIHTAYPSKKYRNVMLVWARRFNKSMIPYIDAMYSE